MWVNGLYELGVFGKNHVAMVDDDKGEWPGRAMLCVTG
jgi:hypothetical protein